MIIMKIMYWLVKICKKKDEATKNKAKNKDKKEKRKIMMIILIRNMHIRFFLGGISTAKISVHQ